MTNHDLGVSATSGSTISIITLSLKGLQSTYSYYRAEIVATESGQKRTFLLSHHLSSRLWKRFMTSCNQSAVVQKLALSDTADSCRESAISKMPGEGCVAFLESVKNAIEHRYRMNDIDQTWIASSSLYKLWLFTCQVSTELFADCFNESGVLSSFCSSGDFDRPFGALGPWEENESSIQGGAGNPPFDPTLIRTIVRRFEEGVRGREPYCRLILLPLGVRFKMLSRLKELTFEGELLLTAPPGSFPLMSEHVLLSRDHFKPKLSMLDSVGIFVWCNREYLLKHKPPMDIEELYEVWIENFCCNAEKVELHKDAFERAFPPELRSSETRTDSFLKEAIHICR